MHEHHKIMLCEYYQILLTILYLNGFFLLTFKSVFLYYLFKMDDLKTHYDYIILGTGIQESILARYLKN